jgi:tetratricopeptide (TPR) repeat protein
MQGPPLTTVASIAPLPRWKAALRARRCRCSRISRPTTPPWPDRLVNLGIVHAAAGRDAEAEAHFRRALGVAPAHAAAWSELGIVLRRQGRLAEADEAYRRALAADPEYPLAWRNRGVLLDLYLGRPGEALEMLPALPRAGRRTDADPQVARWVAELELRSGSRVAGR